MIAQVPDFSQELGVLLNPAKSQVETKSRSHIQRTSGGKKRSDIPGLRNVGSGNTKPTSKKKCVPLSGSRADIGLKKTVMSFSSSCSPYHPKNMYKLKIVCFFTHLVQYSPNFIYLFKTCISSPSPNSQRLLPAYKDKKPGTKSNKLPSDNN